MSQKFEAILDNTEVELNKRVSIEQVSLMINDKVGPLVDDKLKSSGPKHDDTTQISTEQVRQVVKEQSEEMQERENAKTMWYCSVFLNPTQISKTTGKNWIWNYFWK